MKKKNKKESYDKFIFFDSKYCFNKKCNGCKRSRECEAYEDRIERNSASNNIVNIDSNADKK